ncbi:MAG: M67 family metallopeptidase [Magnetococcales bacterium]|nr:M67 family metallopeptidase [Magnetococcales bacterium]MBF0584374.1 M67 family metallopeptidase [Magnetococcales bacterium]
MWHIPRPVLNRMLSHAQRSLPAECVGVLSGQGQTITGWHPLTNQWQDGRRFLADSTELIALLRQLRTEGQQLLAIYHSHPQGDTTPSPTDLQQAYYPDALYLIISLQTQGRLEMNGYRIRDGQATLQALTIVD